MKKKTNLSCFSFSTCQVCRGYKCVVVNLDSASTLGSANWTPVTQKLNCSSQNESNIKSSPNQGSLQEFATFFLDSGAFWLFWGFNLYKITCCLLRFICLIVSIVHLGGSLKKELYSPHQHERNTLVCQSVICICFFIKSGSEHRNQSEGEREQERRIVRLPTRDLL